MMAGLMLDMSGCSPLMFHSCPELGHAMYVFSLHLFTTFYVSRTNNVPLSSRWLRSMLHRFVCNFLLLEYMKIWSYSAHTLFE